MGVSDKAEILHTESLSHSGDISPSLQWTTFTEETISE